MCLVRTARESKKPAKFSISAGPALPMYAGLISMTRAARVSIAERKRVRVARVCASVPGTMPRPQFVGDLIESRSDRSYRALNFVPNHRANFSRQVLAHRDHKPIHFETDASRASDRGKQDRTAMLGSALGHRTICITSMPAPSLRVVPT